MLKLEKLSVDKYLFVSFLGREYESDRLLVIEDNDLLYSVGNSGSCPKIGSIENPYNLFLKSEITSSSE